MSRFLLDTNVALLALTEPERVSRRMRRALDHGLVYLSVISYWEVVLRSMKGKLDVGDPRAWWADALDKLAASPLQLRPDHVSAVYTLAPVHQDPFDRALVAQAIVENLTFATTDSEIPKYASERFRVLS